MGQSSGDDGFKRRNQTKSTKNLGQHLKSPYGYHCCCSAAYNIYLTQPEVYLIRLFLLMVCKY